MAGDQSIPVATAVEQPNNGAVQGTARPPVQARPADVHVMPFQLTGVVVQTEYATPELVELAGRVLQIASTICTLSIIFQIINIIAAVATTTDEGIIANVVFSAIISVLIAIALFRVAYMGVVTKNADHGCASCCPCCPGFLQFYRNLAAIGLIFQIIIVIFAASVGAWLSLVLSILLATVFYMAVSRCQAFLKYLEAHDYDNTRGGELA